MKRILEERVEEYLDGELSATQTFEFEQELLKPETAAALGEALLLRDLLKDLPPDAPPPGLTQRIERALNLRAPKKESKTKTGSSPLGQVAGALKWSLSWPAFAIAGMSGSGKGLKGSISGLNSAGYALGPLQAPARRRMNAILSPEKPLWKRALARLW